MTTNNDNLQADPSEVVTTEAAAVQADAGSLLVPEAKEGDWMPEKFRTLNAEGKLDEGASSRKLAESYAALEKRAGTGDVAPKGPEDYAVEIEGFDKETAESFKADPAYQNFVKAAHAEGMTNKQVNMVINRYMKVAPELITANAELSLQDAKAELAQVWKDDATMNHNLAGVVKAINGFGAEAEDMPGSRARLMGKYGRDPDFIAFAASVANEMKEDGGTPAQSMVASDVDVESLQKSEAYWKQDHPDHARIKGQVDTYYSKKFGGKRR